MNTIREALEIVIAHHSDGTRLELQQIIRNLGHTVRACCDAAEGLLKACLPTTPDLIVSSVTLRDGDAIPTLIKISEENPTPAIIVTPKDSLLTVEQALRDHVMAYLVEPVAPEQIKPTIYLVNERFRQFEVLREENEDLKQALADRKTIEKAKGILMGKNELNEQDAFRRLQKLAQSRRIKLAEYAAELIARENDKNT